MEPYSEALLHIRSIAFQIITTSWGVQTLEPMGDMSHLNHSMVDMDMDMDIRNDTSYGQFLVCTNLCQQF